MQLHTGTRDKWPEYGSPAKYWTLGNYEVMIVAPCSYWGVIDDALRGAAYRGVAVRVMGSYWNHTSRDMLHFMKSLADDTNTGYGGAIETVS